MLKVKTTHQFEKDFQKAGRSGKKIEKIKEVMALLTNEVKLDDKYNDHKLGQNWKGYRECHIEPDWLIIYKLDETDSAIIFVRTGSHSELF